MKKIKTKAKNMHGDSLRKFDGKILDIKSVSTEYGGTEKLWYARVSRRLVPFRKWGSRIIFIRSELDQFFENTLGGCSLEEVKENQQAGLE